MGKISIFENNKEWKLRIATLLAVILCGGLLLHGGAFRFDSVGKTGLAIAFCLSVLLASFTMTEMVHRYQIKIIHNRSGWILVDSLIGVTILVVGLLAIMASYVQTTKASTFSENTTQATYIAQQELDLLKKDMDKDTKTKPTFTESSRTNGIYTISRKVAAVTAPFDDLNIIPINVTVSWDNPKGSSVTVTSYYFYYDSTKI